MRNLFVDTAYWVALLNSRDELHKAAMRATHDLQPYRLITSEFIIVEVLNHLSRTQLRVAAGHWATGLLEKREIQVFPASSMLVEDSLTIYRSRHDKHWSLTDCASIAIMQRLGITEVLSGDHHFEQAGFTVLLKRSDS